MDTYSLVMLAVLLAVFYFMLIRPERNRKKKAEELRSSLKKGDKITTIGGIVGTIVQVGEDTVVIETSDDRVRMEFTKWAISTKGVQTSQDAPDTKGKKDEKKGAAEDTAEETPEEASVPADAESEEEKKD